MTADVKDVDMAASHVSPLSELFDDAQSLIAKNPNAAIDKFKEIITKEADSHPDSLKVKEDAIYELVKIYAKQGRVDDLKALFILIQPFFQSIPKSRTAKIVRSLLDLSGTHATSGGVELQAEICRDAISWCEREKRTFLKQRLQARLAALDLQAQRYKDALRVISRVIRDVKKFDDKLLLVEISLIESRVYLALQNIAKAKGSLTAARSSANAIYCPPLLQSEIDLQAGTLCAEEKDYKTAFSYFYEAFEGYNTIKDTEHAITALKYMLLTKIMNQQAEDVYSIINGKAGVKYAGVEIESMRAVADAYKKRSIHAFEDVYKRFKAQLADDPIIYSHLNDLKDALLEQNLIRLIEPFSRVQIPHVAHLIQLPTPQVEAKLSEMILDKKLNGILDQGSGDLIVFDQVPVDKTYDAAISTIKELSNVVDRLYEKASKLT